VFEPEPSGVISAYVVGLPVYAQGGTPAQAERSIRRTLAAYLEAHPDATSAAAVKVATVRQPTGRMKPAVSIVTTAALSGRRSSRRKAASSRTNRRRAERSRKPVG
jgi:hypothetical protein